MRYRTKISGKEWLTFMANLLWLCIAWTNLDAHPSSYLWGSMSVLFALLVLATVAGWFASYAQLTPHGLVVRTLWIHDEIAYERITSVHEAYVDARAASRIAGRSQLGLRIDYGRSGSALNPGGTAFTNPTHREAFLNALRLYVPQSTFAA
jgi:hypothetical protein